MNVLHIAEVEKFTTPFFRFICEKLKVGNHEVLTRGNNGKWPEELDIRNKTINGLSWFLAFTLKAHRANKIIIHSLFDFKVVVFLFFQPWLLKKCYWIIWGGDLYLYKLGNKNLKWKIREFFRSAVIKRMGFLVTYIDGDVELAREWYGAKGVHRESIMYTSNVFKNHLITVNSTDTINIQVGNSADSSNNHLEVFEKLMRYRDMNILIYVPLSYGDNSYAKKIIKEGRLRFGDKFKPMLDFMPVVKYLSFLGEIDIAIFNHRRQQGMGNTITLLGLGKKVYIRDDVTPWALFERLGAKAYRLSDLDLESIDLNTKYQNKLAIKEYFSEAKLLTQLKSIFED